MAPAGSFSPFGARCLAAWRVTPRVSQAMVNLGPKAKRAGNLAIANPFYSSLITGGDEGT